MIGNGTKHPANYTQVMRYSINMEDWTLKERRILVTTAANMDYEFSNINPAYYALPYKYGYMTQNVFSLNGGLVKLNVEDGSVVVKVSFDMT